MVNNINQTCYVASLLPLLLLASVEREAEGSVTISKDVRCLRLWGQTATEVDYHYKQNISIFVDVVTIDVLQHKLQRLGLFLLT